MPIEPPPDHGIVLAGARTLLTQTRAAALATPGDQRLTMAVVALAGVVAALELPVPPTTPTPVT